MPSGAASGAGSGLGIVGAKPGSAGSRATGAAAVLATGTSSARDLDDRKSESASHTPTPITAPPAMVIATSQRGFLLHWWPLLSCISASWNTIVRHQIL